ncbi:conserved hypothetical protein [Trichinella spiralis]|uniref:hypothetical protein n=1 Tax=Trichinella spiralis TaxID=6334 RepID=UPI0001EFE0F3|nr:conserved hypothetical protein [Trichinella spiralis]
MTGQNNDRRSSYIASDSLPRGRHCVRFFPNACVLVLRLLSESSSEEIIVSNALGTFARQCVIASIVIGFSKPRRTRSVPESCHMPPYTSWDDEHFVHGLRSVSQY